MNEATPIDTRIFIIDDEATNLKLLHRMLSSQGYTDLVLIQDPREVMARYQESPPGLILLDINMPGLDGYEVMAQLKSMNDPLLAPIVILTAQHGRDYLLRALAEGAADFVSKPFERVELLLRVANLIAVHQARRVLYDQKSVLEGMVRQRTQQLQETRLQVVRRLGRAAEYRDNETGMHIVRMSQIASLLAKSMGWSTDQHELMLHASPMHDIGKIGVRDHILLKPGKLTPEEFEIMKTHTSIGADMLAGDESKLISMAYIIALTHHEKWDGTGYPRGLAGEAIPLAGRIVAVADVFDALTSNRPYKKAWPITEATDYVRDNAGKHFDPEVVRHFFLHLPEIVAICEFNADPPTDADQQA